MTVTTTFPRPSRITSLATVAIASLLFVLIVVACVVIGKMLFAPLVASGLRARATVELTSGMLGEILVLVLLVVYMRRRGMTLRQFGLCAPSPYRGWIAAALVAGLFIWFNLALPLRTEPHLMEISVFHVYNSLTAGVVAGFVEEIVFRGFFMTELAQAGFGKVGQVAVSSTLYGLVHAAWGVTSGMFTLQMMGGAIIGTGVFGLFCALVYLASRRSLMPIIVGHAAVDFVIEPWMFMVALAMAQAR